ncbi:MAG: methyltransferase domain-containing protein [Nitrospiraceae bacterium]|nr:methyltransferase domain-containing protein [Nitrospiraceae bacterium]
MRLAKLPGESTRGFLERLRDAVLLRISPAFRERRRLEKMVGPTGVWKALERYQVGCLKALGLRPQHHLLDIGCGPLQGGIPLIRYLDTGRYAGIDIRPESIAEAHRQVRKAKLQAREPFLAVSETFGRDELGERTFDFFWTSQLLYHLDDDLAEMCFTQVAARMRPGARLIGDFIPTDGPSERRSDNWQGFTFFHRPFSFFEDLATRHGMHMLRHGKLRQFGYPVRKTYSLSDNELLEFRKK